MKYAAVMTSDSTIHIPTFKRLGSGVDKLIGGIHIQTTTSVFYRSRGPGFDSLPSQIF
jgi:hypothetical protein